MVVERKNIRASQNFKEKITCSAALKAILKTLESQCSTLESRWIQKSDHRRQIISNWDLKKEKKKEKTKCLQQKKIYCHNILTLYENS